MTEQDTADGDEATAEQDTADGDEATTEQDTADRDEETGRQLVTRRRLLAAGGGAVGVAGGGSLYVYFGLQGDSGGYVAPEAFPRVTTRNAFDEDGTRVSEEPLTPRTTGDWPTDVDELVLFVHGLNTAADEALNQAYTAELGFEEAGRALPTVAYSWDSDRDWGPAKTIADENGAVLADWLVDWNEQRDARVHVIGYSLGARVCGEALQTLAAEGDTDVIESLSLLGGAIPRNSVQLGNRYGDAIDAVDAPIRNFHSTQDNVLGWVYRLSDWTRAVGHGGSADPSATSDSYQDVDVSDQVGDHYSYFEPEDGCLPRLVDEVW